MFFEIKKMENSNFELKYLYGLKKEFNVFKGIPFYVSFFFDVRRLTAHSSPCPRPHEG